MPITKDDVLAWFEELARVYSANKELLTELDSAIGDADHGSNMERGFAAVKSQAAGADIGAIFKSAAATLIKTVGGASGPLYGTFFLRAATVCQGKQQLDAAAVAALFRAGVHGVIERGKAAVGDKTMVDALVPAIEMTGDSIGPMLETAAEAAKTGMLATIPLQARKGRASYLGPRSMGHQDPGATSAYLLIRAAADVWRER